MSSPVVLCCSVNLLETVSWHLLCVQISTAVCFAWYTDMLCNVMLICFDHCTLQLCSTCLLQHVFVGQAMPCSCDLSWALCQQSLCVAALKDLVSSVTGMRGTVSCRVTC
jgi:hypothetical protein